MNSTDYSAIIELAALGVSIESEEETAKIERFTAGLGKLNKPEGIVFGVAYKMLQGLPYSVRTDNPETIANVRALAKQMGASVSEAGLDDNTHGIIDMEFPSPFGITLKPAPRQ